jgi:putative uncharacterized protein FNV0813
MSYFEGLKLTKKGEQLQAKINGNLSETLTFTKAKLGSGSITSNDEIRFLTDVKEEWGTANVTSCKIQGDEKNIVAIEVQFSNAELREDKIFREVGLYAQGNEGEEILYAYANAGDKYDYIPLMKDSPHSFVLVFYFNITSGSKVDAKIDLHSYITHQEFNEEMSKKVNKTNYASAEQYGIVKYGTQENTVLEGNKFTQMMGKDYGGILNEPGLKTSGKAYWDNNTRKLYICKNNNSDISPNVNNYIPFDNGSILERLENLSTFKIQKLYSTPAGVEFTIFQYGRLILIAAYTSGTETLNYGTTYKCNLPYDCYNTATAITGNNGSSGQFKLVNDVLMVNSTDNQMPLRNTFMGQLTTFLK